MALILGGASFLAPTVVEAAGADTATLSVENTSVCVGQGVRAAVSVADEAGSPVSNASVTFSVDGSASVGVQPVVTGSDGVASVTVIDGVAEVVQVSARVETTQGSVEAQGSPLSVRFVAVCPEMGPQVSVAVAQTSLLAGKASWVTVTVTDELGAPVAGLNGEFSWTGSAVVRTSLDSDVIYFRTFTTDANGRGYIPLLDRVAETITVTAMVGEVNGSAEITYLPIPAPDPGQSAIDVSGPTVFVSIRDSAGTGLPLQGVVFTVPDDVRIWGMCMPSWCEALRDVPVTTGSSGGAFVELSSPDGRQVSVGVSVMVDGVAVPLPDSPVVVGTYGPQARVVLNPGTAVAGLCGGSTRVPVVATVVALDGVGSPYVPYVVPGVTVRFTVDGSATIDGVASATVVTDMYGRASVDVVDDVAEEVHVRAVVELVSGDVDAQGSPATATFTTGCPSTDVSMGMVVVSGTLYVGSVLTVWADVEPESASVEYAWYRGSDLVGTGPSYTVVAEDLPAYLSVVATASVPGGDPASETLPILKVGSTRPQLSGSSTVGSTLRASGDGVTPVEVFHTLVWSWVRVSGSSSTVIAGADGPSYQVGADDVGSRLRACLSDVEYPTPVICSAPGPVVEGAGRSAPQVSSVSVAPTVQEAGSPVRVSLSVVDPSGAPVAGLTAEDVMVLVAGEGVPDPEVSSFTDHENGMYTVDVVSQVPGEFTIIPRVDGVVAQETAAVTFTSELSGPDPSELSGPDDPSPQEPAPDPTQSSVSASAQIVEIPGGAGQGSATVTATVKDAQGRMLPGVEVRFAADGGATLLSSSAQTDSSGRASVTLSSSAGAVSVSATIEVDGRSVALSGSPTVVVFLAPPVVSPPDGGEPDVPPDVAPPADGGGQGGAVLPGECVDCAVPSPSTADVSVPGGGSAAGTPWLAWLAAAVFLSAGFGVARTARRHV